MLGCRSLVAHTQPGPLGSSQAGLAKLPLEVTLVSDPGLSGGRRLLLVTCLRSKHLGQSTSHQSKPGLWRAPGPSVTHKLVTVLGMVSRCQHGWREAVEKETGCFWQGQ